MTRSTILANVASDIANNNTGLIDAIHVRRNIMDLANNALMLEDVGTTANTIAAGDDSRITGAVQKAGTGQVLTGQYPYTSHDYGKLSGGNIEILATKHFGVIERDNTSNEIMAPATPPDHHIAIRILIVGTSSTGSPSLTGWDNTDQGDDLPGEDEMAWLRIDLSPEAMTAVVEGINY